MDKFEPKFTITNLINNSLTQIERVRGFLDAARLSDDWIAEMGNQALIKEAHHTTHIEGTTLTLDQSNRLLHGETLDNVDRDDALELLNYRRAFDYISESIASGDPISERLIREIHRKLVEDVRGGKAAAGDYRRIQNVVANKATGETIYTPPTAVEIPLMMSEFVKWLNIKSEIHPILISGIAQFQLVHIHPFLDGNGRTSRLLSTLYLYKSGYDFKRLFTISEFYDRDRANFYQAIQGVRDNGMDLTSWLEYFVTGLQTQMVEVRERGEQVIKRELIVQKESLNERQSKAVDHLMLTGSITINEYCEILPEVTRRTLQRDLKSLVDKSILVSSGATSNLSYTIK